MRAPADGVRTDLDTAAPVTPPESPAVSPLLEWVAILAALACVAGASMSYLVAGESSLMTRATLLATAAVLGVVAMWHHRQVRDLAGRVANERALAAANANRLREVTLLAGAERRILSGGRIDGTLGLILDTACELLGADEGSLMLAETSEFYVAAARGRAGTYIGQRQPLTEGIAGYVARTHRPLVIHGQAERADFETLIGRDETGRVVSSVCVPMCLGDDMVGVVNLNLLEGDRHFTEHDGRILMLFAQHAAIAIRHAGVLGDHPGIRGALDEVGAVRSSVLAQMVGEGTRPAQPPAPTTRPLRVLLVDDDPDVLERLGEQLSLSGHHVLLAADGRTAMDRLRAERPDIVLLDIVLPVLDGWGVLNQIADQPRRPRIICLSGKDAHHDQYRAWTMGVDEYVTKPLEIGRLTELIDEVAARSPGEQIACRQAAIKALLSG